MGHPIDGRTVVFIRSVLLSMLCNHDTRAINFDFEAGGCVLGPWPGTHFRPTRVGMRDPKGAFLEPPLCPHIGYRRATGD